MESTPYLIVGLCLLAGCLLLQRSRRLRKRTERSYTIVTTKPGGDPFNDRIELHMGKRNS